VNKNIFVDVATQKKISFIYSGSVKAQCAKKVFDYIQAAGPWDTFFCPIPWHSHETSNTT